MTIKSFFGLSVGMTIVFGWGACLILNGIRITIGSKGYDIDSDLRRVLIWKRGLLLTKRFKDIPFNQLKQIRVECIEKGFAVKHSFFSVLIDDRNEEMEIDCFERQADAEKFAGMLRSITELPLLSVKCN